MPIKIKKNEENPESVEILAESIIKIADAFEALMSTKLNENAIVQLLRGMPGMSMIQKWEIEQVLANLKRLKSWYTKNEI